MLRRAAAVLFLSALAAAQTPQVLVQGFADGDRVGAALAVGDDLDGDGVPDLLVGAPALPGSASSPGYAVALSGATGERVFRFLTTADADQFGFAVAAAGDADGDGLRDLLVGNPASAPLPGGGEARLFSSATGALSAVLTGGTADSWDAFGHSTCGAGDLTGDGAPDFAVGAPSLSGEQPGLVRVFGADAAPRFDVPGDAAGEQFGFALAAAGDVDLDGVPDLLVGAPAGGFARVVSGAGGATLLTLPGAGGGFARAVSAAGDVNGDGTPDLAVGAPLFHRVDILSGATGLLLRRFEKLAGEFGGAIAPLGDVDADGVPDLLVGAVADAVGSGPVNGAGFVVSGASGQNLFKFAGASAGSQLGAAVAAGDLDGDGRPEMLLGAPGELGPTAAHGAARIYAGELAGSITGFGIGCPGSFLITPRLDLVGDPLPDGELVLTITKGLGGVPALVAVGAGAGGAPLANGCILWAEPLVGGVALLLVGDFPGSGTATLEGRLPLGLPSGLTFSLQALIADPGADGGVSATSAFVVTVP
jgi:hypothetical protein